MPYAKRFRAIYTIYVNNPVDRHGTTALGAIEGKEPALATSSALHDAESPRVEHANGGFILHLFE